MIGNPLNADKEEVQLLVQELTSIKEIIREASRQLARIERRIRAAFPSVASEIRGRERARSNKGPHLNEQSAQGVIAALKASATKGEQIENLLRDYSVRPDLQMVARALGMTNAKLPPKDELVRRISTRIRQSVSVAAGFQEETAAFKKD
jgi:hypothetical protein